MKSPQRLKKLRVITAMLVLGSTFTIYAVHAKMPELTRSEVLKRDLSIKGREIAQVRVDFAPGAASPVHSHPGEEIAYVLEGTLEYQIEGQSPVTLSAGEALFIPAGANHVAKNVGAGESVELATYIVAKNKPLVVLKK